MFLFVTTAVSAEKFFSESGVFWEKDYFVETKCHIRKVLHSTFHNTVNW